MQYVIRISRQPSNKTHLNTARVTPLLVTEHGPGVQQGHSPSNAPPTHKPVLASSTGLCGEPQEKLPWCFPRLSIHLQ